MKRIKPQRALNAETVSLHAVRLICFLLSLPWEEGVGMRAVVSKWEQSSLQTVEGWGTPISPTFSRVLVATVEKGNEWGDQFFGEAEGLITVPKIRIQVGTGPEGELALSEDLRMFCHSFLFEWKERNTKGPPGRCGGQNAGSQRVHTTPQGLMIS